MRGGSQKIGGDCPRWAGTAEDRRGLLKMGRDRRKGAGTAEDGQECFVVSGNKATSETQRD